LYEIVKAMPEDDREAIVAAVEKTVNDDSIGAISIKITGNRSDLCHGFLLQ